MLYYSVKPSLKKVSKYENKFAKLQKEAAKFNFRNQLKTVKKKEFTLEEDHESVSYYCRLHYCTYVVIFNIFLIYSNVYVDP